MPTAKNGYVLPDGRALPSVTTILGVYGGGKEALMYWAWELGSKGFDYKNIRDQAANIGTVVHDRIHADLLGLEWNEAGFEPKHIVASDEPFDVYKAWRKENEIEIIMAEENITSATLGFGGTPDYLCRLNGRIVLIDAKTSSGVYPSHGMQAAAYKKLIEVERQELLSSSPRWSGRLRLIEGVMILWASKGGMFAAIHMTEEELEAGWSDFQHCKALYEHGPLYKAMMEQAPRPKKAKKPKRNADALG